MKGFAWWPYISVLRPLNLFILLLAQGLAALLLACDPSGQAGQIYGENALFGSRLWTLFALMLSTALVFAGGNIINDYRDREADQINKPGKNPIGQRIRPRIAFVLWLLLSTLGAALGVWLGLQLGTLWAAWVPLLAALALWWYSAKAQYMFMLGNLLVTGLIFAAILLPAWMGIWPDASSNGELLTFALLAAGASWSREWIKDLQDREGDLKAGSGSAALRLNLSQNRFGIFLTVLAQIALLPLAIWYWSWNSWVMVIWGSLILLAYLILTFRLFRSHETEEFGRLGNLAKLVMVMGLFWMALLIWSRCGVA